MSELEDVYWKFKETGRGDVIEIPAELWKGLANLGFRAKGGLPRDEIMRRLDLESWDSFAEKRRHHNLNDEDRKRMFPREALLAQKDRQTGRSTRMLVNALVAMSNGLSVNVFGQGSHRSRNSVTSALRYRLRDLAAHVGLDPMLAKFGGGADVEFFDHTYWE